MSMSEHTPKKKNTFQMQLEREATKNIFLLVLIGCLFFSAAIFGINYMNTRLNVQKHLDFLSKTFDDTYQTATDFLNDADNMNNFLANIRGQDDRKDIKYSISKYNLTNPVTIDLILTDDSGNIIYTSFSSESMNLHRIAFNQIVGENALKYDGDIYRTVYYFSGDTSEYVFTKPLYDVDSDSEKPVGYAAIYLNGRDWGKLLTDYQYDSIITTLNGDIIHCSKEGFLKERNGNKYRPADNTGMTSIHGVRYLISSRQLPGPSVILYSFIYYPKNVPYMGIGILTIIFLGVLWFLMSLRLTRGMAERNARSVNLLADELRIIRHGDSGHTVTISTGAEFEEIANHINRMVKSINELNTRNTDLIRLNSMIEMSNLQTQINPHFIYNTLDNIKYLIFSEPDKAAYLIERFTHILRYSINNTKHDVPLYEDMEYIQDYLYIQNTRFGSRFVCSIDIQEECNRYNVPKLLLQPLIENSIKYGFKKRMDIAVAIRGWCEEDSMVLTVEDNGPGVPRTTLETLRTMLASEEIKTEHNGLQNLARRIVLEYGEGSGMSIDSMEGEYFKVTVRLKHREG